MIANNGKTNWIALAVLGAVSTAVAGGMIVYANNAKKEAESLGNIPILRVGHKFNNNNALPVSVSPSNQ